MRMGHFLSSWRLEMQISKCLPDPQIAFSADFPVLQMAFECLVAPYSRRKLATISNNLHANETKKNQLIFTVWHRPDSGRRLHWVHQMKCEKPRHFVCMENWTIPIDAVVAWNLHFKIYDSFSAHFEVRRDEWWNRVTSRSPNANFDGYICTAQRSSTSK